MNGRLGTRVFISAVTGEFGAHRAEAARALIGADIDVREQGVNFRQERGTLLEGLGDYIAACDTVICLIGGAAGAPPTEEELRALKTLPTYLRCLTETGLTELSRTQWEFILAQHYQRRTLVWMTPDERLAGNSDSRQIAFRKWVKALGLRREPLFDVDDFVKRLLIHFVAPTSVRPGQPPLGLRAVANKVRNRFFFAAEAIDFIGRDADISRLKSMLDLDAGAFRWSIVHGPGGVGKSRLAHELCKQLDGEWSAGFLSKSGLKHDWQNWQPILPTFIVVDYAARASVTSDADNSLAAMIAALADRAAGEGAPLARPVRLLLLERANATEWLDQIYGESRNTVDTKFPTAKGNDFLLATVEDPAALMAFVIEAAGQPVPARDTMLAKLTELDPERRPLFAHLLADAMLRDRENWRALDVERLLDDVIDRERLKFWKPAGAGPPEERALALATMTDGIDLETLAEVTSELLPKWDVDRHPGCFVIMSGAELVGQLAAMEPDIVGEHFVLQTLTRLSQANRQELCALAWSISPSAMARFTIRAHHDVPGHPCLTSLLLPPSGEKSQNHWFNAVLALIDVVGNRDAQAGAELLEVVSYRDFPIGFGMLHDAFCDPTMRGFWRQKLRECVQQRLTIEPPETLARSLFDTPLGLVGSFFAKARGNSHNTLTDALYAAMAMQPERLAAGALASDIGGINSFLIRAEAHNQKVVIDALCLALKQRPQDLAQCALAAGAGLGEIRSFIATALRLN